MKKMIKDYVIEKELGSGCFGTAYLVRSQNNSKEYVIKESKYDLSSEDEKEDALREVQALITFNSEYIVKYIDSFFIGQKLYIVTEYCPGGDLFNFIRGYGNNIPENEIIRLFTQICKGLSVIHQKNLIHRDLKTSNIFLSKESGIKIGDFGLAKNIKLTYAKTCCGTQIYMVPELFKKDLHYGKKADIWS